MCFEPKATCLKNRKEIYLYEKQSFPVKNIEGLKAIVGPNIDLRYNKALCDLMNAKKKRLMLIVPHEAENYFNKNDRAAIMSWEPEIARKVFKEIEKYIKCADEKGFVGFSSGTCPFCIKLEVETGTQPENERDCITCEYGQEHVSCLSIKTNRYSLISNKLKNLIISPRLLLNLKWYLKVLKDIKQKHNID